MPWLNLIPRWLLLSLLAVVVAAPWVAWVACRLDLAQAHLRLAQLQAVIATERAQDADAGRLATERYRAAELRTAAAGQEITNATIQASQMAGRAAVRAADSGAGLRKRAAAVAARCGGAAEHPAAATDSASAASSCAVLADVLGQVEAAGRGMAETADARGIAGTDCERRYDALKQ